MARINIYNFLYFEAAWFACVFLTSNLALLLIAPFTIIQLVWGKNWQLDLRVAFTFTLVGAIAESFALGTGAMVIAGNYSYFPPPWLLAMWFCFGLATNYSLAWLRTIKPSPIFVQSLFAGLFAPVAYIGAEKLGAVELSQQGWLMIALIWAIAFPLAMLITTPTRALRHENI